LIHTVIDHSVNLQHARPGDVIEVPYELTVGGEFRELWFSAFYNHDRINTSTPFARKLGLQDQVLPFSLMLFLTGSMSHADAAKVQVGFHNAFYHWPGFAGDTFTKKFQVKSVRNTSDGNHSVITFNCELINQRGRVCMSADKTMLFEFEAISPSNVETPVNPATEAQLFRTHLMAKAEVLGEVRRNLVREGGLNYMPDPFSPLVASTCTPVSPHPTPPHSLPPNPARLPLPPPPPSLPAYCALHVQAPLPYAVPTARLPSKAHTRKALRLEKI